MKGACNDLLSKADVGISTIVLVKNRCQFCYAFFKDPEKIVEHSQRCDFRFAESFEAFDGKVKFACAVNMGPGRECCKRSKPDIQFDLHSQVCFDVFLTQADHKTHELLHKYPGGFPCSVCDDIFLNEVECVQHMERAHEVIRQSK